MDLDQLRQLMKVAEIRNFTRAAAAIGLSQSALSRSIARLEEELGQPLFTRESRLVTLTEAGIRLLAKARQILSLVEEAKAEIGDDGETGLVRVGSIPTIAPYFLPGLLRSFSDRYPRSRVMVQEDTTDNLLKKVADGTVDIAIVARPLTAKYLEVEDLFEEELLVVLPANHFLGKKVQLRITDIESLPFVLLGEAHCLTDHVMSFCRQQAFHPVSVERTSQLTTVQELVALDHGVSFIPAMAQRLDTSDRRIYRSVTKQKPTRRIVMAWNSYRFRSKLLRHFEDHIRQHVVKESKRFSSN